MALPKDKEEFQKEGQKMWNVPEIDPSPKSGILFGAQNFVEEFKEILGIIGRKPPPETLNFTLSNAKVTQREKDREQIETSPVT